MINIFEVVNDIYPFGEAPEKLKTYATWQTLSGEPVHYLKQLPNNDLWEIQIDCWSDTVTSVREKALEIRDKLEQNSWDTTIMTENGRDFETRLYRYTMRFRKRVNR